MNEVKLTSQQKKYLLYLMESDAKNSISKFSRRFDCSRVNSKKILDKMLKLGVLYKEDNKYYVTSYGRKLGADMYENSQRVTRLIENVFFIEHEYAKEYSERFCTELEGDFSKQLKRKAKAYARLPEEKICLTSLELVDIIFEKGSYPISFVAYKHHPEDDESAIDISMANLAFEDKAVLEIGDENVIVLKAKSLIQKQDGYIKEGNLMSFTAFIDGKEKKLTIRNSHIRIPLSVFSTWMHLGGGIFTSNIWFKSSVSIGIKNHYQKSNYLFVVNLAQL